MQRVCKLGMDGVSGEGLMPGMYTSKSFTESLDKKGASYGFRTMERDKIPKIGPGQDKVRVHSGLVKSLSHNCYHGYIQLAVMYCMLGRIGFRAF